MVTKFNWDLPADGFCRSTLCPICGEEVFFVRHNGGSVWFDELGPPWTKHECFEQVSASNGAQFSHQHLSAISSQVIGVISSGLYFGKLGLSSLVFLGTDGRRYEGTSRLSDSVECYMGRLVELNFTNGRFSGFRDLIVPQADVT